MISDLRVILHVLAALALMMLTAGLTMALVVFVVGLFRR